MQVDEGGRVQGAVPGALVCLRCWGEGRGEGRRGAGDADTRRVRPYVTWHGARGPGVQGGCQSVKLTGCGGGAGLRGQT